MVLREQDKHFLWSIFAGVAIILFWKGIWEGIGSLPLLENPWVSLFVGFTMLTFSGIIFKELDPLGSLEKSTQKVMQFIAGHPKKQEFHIVYRDRTKKQDVVIKANKLKEIEKNLLVIVEKDGSEFFVPMHRIKEIRHKGKPYWRS